MAGAQADQALEAPHKVTWLDEEFEKWVKDLQDKYHIPGTSVAVVDNGRVESAGYGLARLPDVPATADTLYCMASTTKAFAAAVMGLILKDDTKNDLPNTTTSNGQTQKIKWTTPVVKILGEDFDLDDSFLTQRVTIEDALSHRSGLCGHDFHYGPVLGTGGSEHTQALRHLGAVSEHFRTKFQYSNIMYGVVGHIIEKLDGSFDSVARQRIWKPLGMNDTFNGFDSPAMSTNDGRIMSRGYYWVDDGGSDEKSGTENGDKRPKENGHYVAEGYFNLGPIIGPAGGIVSSVNDYSKWIAALLEASKTPHTKDGKGPESKESRKTPPVISHDLWKDMTTPRTFLLPVFSQFPDVNPSLEYADINPPTYGLGWFSGPWMFSGQTIVHHAGGIPGYGTHVFLLPKHNFGIAVASNSANTSNKLAEQIGRELLGRKIGISKDERRCQGEYASKKDESKAVNIVDAKNDEPAVQVSSVDIPTEPIVPIRNAPVEAAGLPDSFDPKAVVGMYKHEAYGEYKVSIVSSSASLSAENPSLDGNRIVRKISSSAETKDTKVAGLVLQADPQGGRSFQHTIILHSPPVAARSAQTFEHTFLSLEKLWAHGSLRDDPVPGLPQGHGKDDDPKYPFKQEALWGADYGTNMSCGACFERNDEGKTKRLGLVLGNTPSMEAAMRTGDDKDLPLEDFRDKMIWFEKIE
ncbi:hypothetical protein H2198_000724 [Neophaeococcomyces mojaviensis]|uniref:Uncharacterized protein n=1 Tax=Neophaeococcomyces mojaviensis TaxID=3383035 RepID=A0ACC3AJ88_9EURO|nr:hypothetical protein H2198_000724 [Knufia sp. JES_112]